MTSSTRVLALASSVKGLRSDGPGLEMFGDQT